MKIVIIGPAYPLRGGIAAFNDRLAKALMDDGHEVIVHTFKLQYPKLLFPGKTQYSEDPAPAHLKIEESINSINPINWFVTGNHIRKIKADLILVRFWLPFMGPCLGTILRLIRKDKKSRILAIVDNIIPHEARPGDRMFTRYFVRAVDAFVVMSKTVLEGLRLFDTEKPRVLTPHPLYDHYGEIKPKQDILNKFRLKPGQKIILFFGLIRDYKGLDLLLEAFSDERFRKDQFKLIIAGEYYANRQGYDELIQKYQLEEEIIQFDKYIPDAEVADYFSVCDLVVQPYKSATQSGITQIAYHFNKPMVVTNVGGLAEMCPDGKVGYVVNREPKAIADAILRFFYKTDQDLMLRNIIEEKKRFGWDILVENILKLYSNG